MRIGLRIREARRQQRMYQRDLAASAGISQGYLSELENGEKNPSMAVAERLAKGLGSSLSSLLETPPAEAPVSAEVLGGAA